MSKPIITVVGSTGTIGTELVDILSQSDVSIRAVLRNTNAIKDVQNVVWVQADLSRNELLDATIAGTDRLFLLTGNRFGFSKTQIAIIEAAERLGVKHVVKLSALGATPRTKSPLAKEHWDAEQALENTTMSWTILRPHAFMQNWLGEVAETVRNEGNIYAAIGEGKVPFIDARDIAAVAAQALLHTEKHNKKHYVLTGGKAIGYDELAQAISKATGKNVTYQSLSMEEMRTRMEKQGLAPKMIESYLALAAYQKAGGPTERTSNDVKEILNRNPLTIYDFADHYRNEFLKT